MLKYIFPGMIIIATALALSASLCQAQSQDELLEKLASQQTQIETLQQQVKMLINERQQTQAPEIDTIISQQIEQHQRKEHFDFGRQTQQIDIHGFVSQGFLQTTNNNYLVKDSTDGSFEFNEMGLNFATNLSDRLRVGLQLFSRDFGDLGNNEIVLDWAYADYRWQDWLGLRLGKLKSPYGLYNETRDIDMLRTSIFLPQSIYSEGMRDSFTSITGIGIYGDIPLEELGNLSYQLMWGTTDIENDSGIAQNFDGWGIYDADKIDLPYMYAAELIWNTPLEGLRLSGTGRWTRLKYHGTTNRNFPFGSGLPVFIDVDNLQIYTISAEYVNDRLTLYSELASIRGNLPVTVNQVPTDTNQDGIPDSTTNGFILQDNIYDTIGYYWGGSYRFTPWFELGSYYSVFIDEADEQTKDIALTGRFDITDNWIFKLEGHYFTNGNTIYETFNPNGVDNHWFLFAAKMTFSF